jgi:predicted metalloprotease
MKWQDMNRSDNVEVRGGVRPVHVAGGLGGGGILVIIILSLLLGVNPLALLGIVGGGPTTSQTQSRTQTQSSSTQVDFVRAVLGDTEQTWEQIFQQSGETYADPKLVLYSGAVNSACGYTSSAVGPFYCPGDEEVYLDLSFFTELSQRFGAPGDFARAYVIAHEIGHHVQKLLGISAQVEAAEAKASDTQRNAISVRVELQADCFAGVWGHYVKQEGFLDPGDLSEALQAASAVGDDTLQKETQGYVVPDSFTHGTSAQRMKWFKTGFDSGNPSSCDTFGASGP